MTSAGKLVQNDDGSQGPNESVLRAKYLDYCSARVAEALLLLSPDEMYVLANDALGDSGTSSNAPLSYDEAVRLATRRISSRLDLPDFDTWSARYRQDPARFERELIGLWKSALDGPASTG